MPELPEVQTITNDLRRKVKGAKILSLWTDHPKMVKLPGAARFKTQIKGAKIEDVTRIGKNIIFHLDKGKAMLVHQKMTGHLMVGRWSLKKGKVVSEQDGPLKERVNQYIHALFTLNNSKMIAFSDMRKFGRIAYGKKEQILDLPDIKDLGPDALDPSLTPKKLQEILSSSKRAIKAVLMDPKKIAGIGNIYADDILWSAKIHPLRPANKITLQESERILKYTRSILKRALKLRGSSVGDYRDTAGEPGGYGKVILAYRKTGEPCKRCKVLIQKTKVGQRSAHFCPQCQA